MYHKTFLKIAGLLSFFAFIDLLVIFYWLMRCNQTNSPFYCEGAIGVIFIFTWVIIILLILALVSLSLYKWYRGSNFTILITILGILIFSLPYLVWLYPGDGQHAKTYNEYLSKQKQRKSEIDEMDKQRCIDLINRMLKLPENQRPVLTPGCDYDTKF